MAQATVPWSGWWWPIGYFPPPLAAEDGPLDKLDQYLVDSGVPNPGARSWEAIHHYEPGCSWCGHCHGWAAAAVLEPEPTIAAKEGAINFTIGDLKGLLTEVHCTDAMDLFVGIRGPGSGRDDELKATEFHEVLLDWVSNGEPVIMDKTKKPEVWNYPVYKCELTTQPDQDDPQKTHVKSTLWFVSDGVSSDHVGTLSFQATYQYWIAGDFQNPSDGGWEDGSQDDHPGFIWHPAFVNPQSANANPAVKYYDPYILELLDRFHVLIVALPDLELRVIEPPEIPDMSPYSLPNALIYRGLATRDPFAGHAVPAMASSWEISADALTCTFHLRNRATFHNGAPVTAEDVAFTYRAMMNPDLGSPYCGALRESIASMSVTGEHTIVFRLQHSLANFPNLHGWHWIFPKHTVEKVGWKRFMINPIGSGPFAVKAYDPGHHLTLIPHSGYYLGPPTLDRITFLEIPDVDQRLELVVENKVDIALFEYTLELERRSQEMSSARAFAVPTGAPRYVEVQNCRLRGRIPNEFDGAWNAVNWTIDLHAPGPMLVTPVGSLRRRSIREGSQMGTKNPRKRHPEWHVGTWWQVQVRQRAMAAKRREVGWTQPFRLLFEVIGEEVIEDRPCYRVRVTYLDRPRSAEYQYVDTWITKDQRTMLKGKLQIGNRSIPLRHHFLTKLLEATPLKVDTQGVTRSLFDPRWPERKIELQAYEGRSPTGGTRISSLTVPFALRIDEPTYTVELTDWGI